MTRPIRSIGCSGCWANRATVTAEIATLLNPDVPDDNGIAIFRYADGLIAEIACSFTAVAAENTVELFAEKGVLVQNLGDLTSAIVPRSGRDGPEMAAA